MEISQRIAEFLVRSIDSVEQLRVLLLLQEDPAREWSAVEISRELRSTEASIAKRLEDLYFRGVLAKDAHPAGKHRYVPANAMMGETVRELSGLYAKRPYRVIEVIYSKPPEALQDFADAFRIRRKD